MAKKSATAKSTHTTGTASGASLTQFVVEDEQRQRLHKQAGDLVKLQKSRLQRVSRDYVGLFPTCTWDLETSNLNASIGYLLCCVVKPWRQEPVVFRIDESPNYEADRSDDKMACEADKSCGGKLYCRYCLQWPAIRCPVSEHTLDAGSIETALADRKASRSAIRRPLSNEAP